MQKLFRGSRWFHSGQFLNTGEKVIEPADQLGANSNASCATATKTKRKKLKGKRAVVRWLKFFRWKKKKEYERMTAEEKLLYKLRKARKKEERLSEALQKIEPKDPSKTTHDPEILTPEEHFYFWKMGLKCKNYVPIGRRGIYQGVILNMHLHWKKHQTLQVIVKTFSQEEVKEIAVELARLSGGIVLGIHEENTIIMYRGKNYSQPPTEIMSPRITLSRKKALDKSKYRDGLRAVKKYIPRLEQELELLQAQANRRGGDETGVLGASDSLQDLGPHLDSADRPRETATDTDEDDLGISSGSEALSDIFETESSGGDSEREERPLYLHEFDKLPVESDEEPESFEEQLEQISSSRKDAESPSLDEVDKLVLRAASLLKKKRR